MGPDLIKTLLPVAFTQLVAFLVFIWLLNKFAVKPVLGLLDQRREKIAGQFDQIASSEKQIAALKEDYERKLQEINEEARKRVAEEVTRGKRIADEIAANARTEASAILEKAKTNVQIQVDKARAQLKEDIVDMTIAATERLIQAEMDEKQHRELVGAFIDEVEQHNS